MRTNDERVERIDKLVGAPEPMCAQDRLDFVTDIIADLMHWSDVRGVDFARALLWAQLHYEEECRDEGLLSGCSAEPCCGGGPAARGSVRASGMDRLDFECAADVGDERGSLPSSMPPANQP